MSEHISGDEYEHKYNQLYENPRINQYLHSILLREVKLEPMNYCYPSFLFNTDEYIKQYFDTSSITLQTVINTVKHGPMALYELLRSIKDKMSDLDKSLRKMITLEPNARIDPIPMNPYQYGKFFLQSKLCEFDIAFVLEYVGAYKQPDISFTMIVDSCVSLILYPFYVMINHFGYNAISFITGNQNLHVSCFFIESLQTIYILNYGTCTVTDACLDCDLRTTDFMNSYVHSGFFNRALNTYNHILEPILRLLEYQKNIFPNYPPLRIVIGGHSLGGAVSQLLYLIFKYQMPENNYFCVTFGAPLSVSKAISDSLLDNGEVINFINKGDPIPGSTRVAGNLLKMILQRYYKKESKPSKSVFYPLGNTYLIDEEAHSFVPLGVNQDGLLHYPIEYSSDGVHFPCHRTSAYIVHYYNILMNI